MHETGIRPCSCCSIEKAVVIPDLRFSNPLRTVGDHIRSRRLTEGLILSVDELWLSRETEKSGTLKRMSDPRTERELIEALSETRGRISGPAGAAAKLQIPASTCERDQSLENQ
jgi:hypothetical protein